MEWLIIFVKIKERKKEVVYVLCNFERVREDTFGAAGRDCLFLEIHSRHASYRVGKMFPTLNSHQIVLPFELGEPDGCAWSVQFTGKTSDGRQSRQTVDDK